MTNKVAELANRCSEEFRAMANSIEKTAETLHTRFAVEVVLATGRTLALLGSDALNQKFQEYLTRAQERLLLREAEHGHQHTDYQSFLASLSSAYRHDTENRTTERAWRAA